MFAKFLLLLPLFMSFQSVHSRDNTCRPKLLRSCFCETVYYDERSLYTVNCTNTQFNNTEMLRVLPEETQMLIFNGNHVPTLEINLFGETVDLNLLEFIDMSNNGIQDIKGQAFHHVRNVKRLILNHNRIVIANQPKGNFHHPRVFSNLYNLEELHLTNAFADNTGATLANDLHDIFVNSNLTKLYKLHLEQNEIISFKDDRVFCNLLNLHDLYLGDNNIPEINFDITCLPKLRYLDLESNNISALSRKDLDTLDQMVEPYRHEHLLLEINNNPLKCDAAFKNFYGWLQTTKVEIRNKDHLECHQLRRGKQYIMNLRNFAEAKQTKITQALMVLLVVLVFLLATLFSAYVYLKKESVRMRIAPLLDRLTRKVHYTTIESQDV